MVFLLELLVGSIRILLFFFGAIFTFILGESLYRLINTSLFSFAVPCMEMLSFIIAIIAPVAYFFGIYHQKSFFQRESSYNKGIFVVAFLLGAAVAFLPITGVEAASPVCTEQIHFVMKVLQSLVTGVLTAFIAYLSFDIGVYQSLYITPALRKSASKNRKKR